MAYRIPVSNALRLMGLLMAAPGLLCGICSPDCRNRRGAEWTPGRRPGVSRPPRCPCAADAGPMARGLAQQVFRLPHHVLHRQPQLPIDPLVWRGRAEPLEPEHHAVIAHPAI